MDIRWLKTDEEKAAVLELLAKEAPSLSVPPLNSLAGKFVDGKLVGVIGVQRPVVVECLVTDGEGHSKDLIVWLDGALASIPTYYAFITKNGLPEVVKRYYGDVTEQFEGTLIVRRR